MQSNQQKNETHALHLFIITIHPKKWKINRNELILLLNNKELELQYIILLYICIVIILKNMVLKIKIFQIHPIILKT